MQLVGCYNSEVYLICNGAKWKDGKFGKALEFDGGQWVTIDSTPELQVGSEDDLTTIAEHGLAKALGGLAVSPTNKLATTWAILKANH